MSRAEQQQLEMTTDISMLVRTLQANGTIAFIGSRASDESDLDTFLAIELLNGQLRANVKLGGRDVHSFIGGSGLNDGKVHAIRILPPREQHHGLRGRQVGLHRRDRAPVPTSALGHFVLRGRYAGGDQGETAGEDIPYRRPSAARTDVQQRRLLDGYVLQGHHSRPAHQWNARPLLAGASQRGRFEVVRPHYGAGRSAQWNSFR